MAFLKDKAVWVVGALVIVLIIISVKSCDIYDKYSELRAQTNMLLEQRDDLLSQINTQVEVNATLQAEMDTQIAELRSQIDSKTRTIDTLGHTIGELETSLTNDLSDKEKIRNLEAQVSVWKQRFTLLEDVVEDKDRIIFSLTEKYKSANSLLLTYESVIESDDAVIESQKVQIKLLEGKFKTARFGKKTLLVTGLVLGGFIIYEKLIRR